MLGKFSPKPNQTQFEPNSVWTKLSLNQTQFEPNSVWTKLSLNQTETPSFGFSLDMCLFDHRWESWMISELIVYWIWQTKCQTCDVKLRFHLSHVLIIVIELSVLKPNVGTNTWAFRCSTCQYWPAIWHHLYRSQILIFFFWYCKYYYNPASLLTMKWLKINL